MDRLDFFVVFFEGNKQLKTLGKSEESRINLKLAEHCCTYYIRTYTHTHTAKYKVEYCQTVKHIHIPNHAQSIQTCT